MRPDSNSAHQNLPEILKQLVNIKSCITVTLLKMVHIFVIDPTKTMKNVGET